MSTGIITKTSIARAAGGWNAKIGSGDDARYSYDIFNNSKSVLFDTKSTLYISRRRVFPKDISWLLPKILRKKHKNDYSKSAR